MHGYAMRTSRFDDLQRSSRLCQAEHISTDELSVRGIFRQILPTLF